MPDSHEAPQHTSNRHPMQLPFACALLCAGSRLARGPRAAEQSLIAQAATQRSHPDADYGSVVAGQPALTYAEGRFESATIEGNSDCAHVAPCGCGHIFGRSDGDLQYSQ